MRSINEATLLGFVGDDAELKHGNSGAFIYFSMATNRNTKDASGEWQSETTWHRIIAFGRQAEQIAPIRKGEAMMVQGRIKYSRYTKNDGTEVPTTQIVAHNLARVVKPEKSGTQGNTGQQSQHGPRPDPNYNAESGTAREPDPVLDDDVPW